MKYVSFAERQGIKKGARKILEAAMEAKFGAEGKALVQRLYQSTDLARLEALARAAALAGSLDEARSHFEGPNGNG